MVKKIYKETPTKRHNAWIWKISRIRVCQYRFIRRPYNAITFTTLSWCEITCVTVHQLWKYVRHSSHHWVQTQIIRQMIIIRQSRNKVDYSQTDNYTLHSTYLTTRLPTQLLTLNVRAYTTRQAIFTTIKTLYHARMEWNGNSEGRCQVQLQRCYQITRTNADH
jgi:hypothetical protein